MKANDIAKHINGIDLDDLSLEITQEAARNNVILVYGISRDTVAFTGAIEGEADIPEGGLIHFDRNGLLPDVDDVAEDDLADYYDRKRMSYVVDANWNVNGFPWSFTTAIPHHRFVVIKEGARYCRGIVFDYASIGGKHAGK